MNMPIMRQRLIPAAFIAVYLSCLGQAAQWKKYKPTGQQQAIPVLSTMVNKKQIFENKKKRSFFLKIEVKLPEEFSK